MFDQPEGTVQRRQTQALFSAAQWQDQRQWVQTKAQEIPSEHEETLFHCEGNQGLAQVACGGCVVSILGGIQKLAGHGSGQLAVGGPAWARGLDRMTSRGAFQPQSVILWNKSETSSLNRGKVYSELFYLL